MYTGSKKPASFVAGESIDIGKCAFRGQVWDKMAFGGGAGLCLIMLPCLYVCTLTISPLLRHMLPVVYHHLRTPPLPLRRHMLAMHRRRLRIPRRPLPRLRQPQRLVIIRIPQPPPNLHNLIPRPLRNLDTYPSHLIQHIQTPPGAQILPVLAHEMLNLFPPGDLVAEHAGHIDLLAERDDDLPSHAGEEAREAAVLGHEVLGAFYEDGEEGGGGCGFENEAGYAPFEVAEGGGGVLVDAAFGEDVEPGVLAVGVGRGWGRGVGRGGGGGGAREEADGFG